MTLLEQSQIELCMVLLSASIVVFSFAFYWAGRRRRVRPAVACWAVVVLSVMVASYALTDGENGKPVPPVVLKWMRVKREWLQWTKAVQTEWQQIISGIEARFISVQGLYGDVIAVTNSIPIPTAPVKTLQLRMDNIDNPNNQNFKARATKLNDNGDGTWTVEVKNSRAVYDAPSMMMYLRRRSDGAVWWVQHESSSFPTNTADNAYSYTFRMPVNVTGYLAVSSEVLLGGNNGLKIEGIVLVDPIAGQMYEGISGTYIFGDRTITVKGGQFLMEPETASVEDDPPLLQSASRLFTPVAHRPVMSMPPLDASVRHGVAR